MIFCFTDRRPDHTPTELLVWPPGTWCLLAFHRNSQRSEYFYHAIHIAGASRDLGVWWCGWTSPQHYAKSSETPCGPVWICRLEGAAAHYARSVSLSCELCQFTSWYLISCRLLLGQTLILGTLLFLTWVPCLQSSDKLQNAVQALNTVDSLLILSCSFLM